MRFRDMISSASVVRLFVLVWASVHPATLGRATEPPSVVIALARPEVYAGEDPGLTITVTAPAGEAVTVVKPDHAYFGHLGVDLTGLNGRRVPGGLMAGSWEDEPHNFILLAAGKSTILRLDLLYQPTEEGEYRVDVTFRPTPDRHKVRSQLKLISRVLTPQDIFVAVAAPTPEVADPRKPRPTVDILVVKTGAGRTLFYRRRGPEGGVFLQRLWPVVEPDNLSADVVGYDPGRVAGTIKVTYDEHGKQVAAEVDYWTGGVIKGPPPAVAPPPRPAK